MKYKLLLSITAGIFAVASLSGCVAKSEYDDCVRRNDTLKERINSLESDQNAWQTRLDKCQSENEILKTISDANQKKVNLLTAQNTNQQNTIKDLASMIGQNALPVSLSTAISTWAATSDMIDFDEKTGMVKLNSDLLFNKGDDTVQSAARTALQEFGKIINTEDAQPFDIVIVGHTDDVPIKKPATLAKHPTNWHLSAHRAISVERLLSSVGVSEKRMVVAGLGEQRPVALNAAGNKGNEKNRRVEIYILPANSLFRTPTPESPASAN